MDELLNEVDVTDIAENDESLKAKYKAETCYDGEVEGWIVANPVAVRGPYQHVTAIVIKLNGGAGEVRIFRIYSENDHRRVCEYLTGPDREEKVLMVLLKPDYYCYLMEGVQTKYIK